MKSEVSDPRAHRSDLMRRIGHPVVAVLSEELGFALRARSVARECRNFLMIASKHPYRAQLVPGPVLPD